VAHLARTRVHRSLVATLVGVALLALVSACGMNAQTLQPYTPAEGVNANVGPTGEWVQVRNLMILSREDGSGFVSASLVATERDALTGVAGHPFKPDGSEGAEFTTTMPDPIGLTPGVLVVLTDREFITVESPDLLVGGAAELTLTFSTVGDLIIRVPVVDADQPDYATVTPNPSPTPTPSS
jgi:hypothetical protein